MKEQTIQANWKPFERRPTWSYASVQEIAKVLNISPQSVHNRIGRGQLPEPDENPQARGNKSWFRISKVRACLEDRPEEEIHWEWVRKAMPEYAGQFKSIGQAQYLIGVAYDLFGIEKPI